MPDTTTPQTDWIKYFNEVMGGKTIPAAWAEMPADYKARHEGAPADATALRAAD